MSTSSAKNYARRARSRRTVEDKLDEIAKAIEELADAVEDVEGHARNAEIHAANASARR
jgi:hypothetical protein